MIKGVVNLMATTQVMEDDDWMEAQIISKSIVLHIDTKPPHKDKVPK
jgi:hypothetical protein